MKKILLIFGIALLVSCSKDDPATAPTSVVMNRVIEEKFMYFKLTPNGQLNELINTVDWQRRPGTDLLFFSNDIKDDGKIINSNDYFYQTSATTSYRHFIRYIIRKQ